MSSVSRLHGLQVHRPHMRESVGALQGAGRRRGGVKVAQESVGQQARPQRRGVSLATAEKKQWRRECSRAQSHSLYRKAWET